MALLVLLPLIAILTISHLSMAGFTNSTTSRSMHREESLVGYHTIISCALFFLAASVSSAGGIGGGSLFLPILNLVAGLDLKTATTYSAFMVTGGSLANVLHNLLFFSAAKPPINYQIALLSQPSMLVGVSLGVICHIMFPEWLITVLFAAFLAFSTYRTCKAGLRCWNAETEEMERSDGGCRPGRSAGGGDHAVNGVEEALLAGGAPKGRIMRFPYKDMVVLVMIWVCFFLLHVLKGDKHGRGAVNLKPCGVAYWFITFSQIPLSIAFTVYILYEKKNSSLRDHQQLDSEDKAEIRIEDLPMFVFPLAALLTGVLSGLFGIGGGLLTNPLLLQIGIPPETAAATSTFMVMFSSSMTTVQYIILGMTGIDEALVYAVLCFVASAIGLVVMKRIILQSGRVSLIVFTVTAVMALSTATVVCYGTVDVWREYSIGKYMGFRPPC